MKNNLPKIIVVLGQTATGKSDLAVKLAKKLGGEIISADSRQVYRGMNLGTGKIAKKEMRGVPHHLLNVASPKKVFFVSDYQKLAEKKIREIFNRGKIPIVCGGSGFYIDVLLGDVVLPNVKPDEKLREKLGKKSASQLFEILKKLDKNRTKNIDKNNKARLIRAIEIARNLGRVPKTKKENRYNALKIGLTLPDEVLKEKIKKRLVERIKKGMLREIKNLHEKDGVSWQRMHEFGLEYRYDAMYLQNKISKEDMIKQLNTAIWHYAKRQKTWFKRDKNIVWVDPRKNKEKSEVLKQIKKFLI